MNGASRAPRQRLEGVVLAASVAALGVVVVALAVVSNGNPAVATAPMLLIAVLYAVWKLPLRWTAVALIGTLLGIDQGTDSYSLWHSPLHLLADLLAQNIDSIFPASRIKFTGLEALLALLLAVVVHRKATGLAIDSRGQVQTAGLLGDFVLIWLAAVIYVTLNGMAHGGSTSILIFQARPMLHYALLFFFFQAAFRGPRDHELLGRLIVLCASSKAAMAVWIRYAVLPSLNPEMTFATNHGDSILFCLGCMVLIAHFAERTDRRRLLHCLLFLPLIICGMVANTRRLAWVELCMAFLGVYAVSPWVKWKRAVTRATVVALPVLALYAYVGWSQSGGFFAPVQTMRSVIDAKIDRSTWWRDVENWNIVMSMRERPFLGRGFGHEYGEFIQSADISSIFELYRAAPHNSVLGLLLFAGVCAFTAIWSLFGLLVFLAVRAYRRAQLPEDRAAALCCLAAAIVISAQAYGDIGLFSTQSKIMTALALSVVGKLAVAMGAWPARVRNRGPAREPSHDDDALPVVGAR